LPFWLHMTSLGGRLVRTCATRSSWSGFNSFNSAMTCSTEAIRPVCRERADVAKPQRRGPGSPHCKPADLTSIAFVYRCPFLPATHAKNATGRWRSASS
jgi:hypothetical protein